MQLFVPFKLKEEPNSYTASLPFDPDFEVKASSRRQAADLVWKDLGRLIQVHKPLELIEKLPHYQKEKGYNYVVVNLFAPYETIAMCSPFCVVLFLLYCGSWFFIANIGLRYTEVANMPMNAELIAKFQTYQVHLGLTQVMLFLLVWGWFYSYVYPYLRNRYALTLLNNPKTLSLHQRTIGKLAGFLRKETKIQLNFSNQSNEVEGAQS